MSGPIIQSDGESTGFRLEAVLEGDLRSVAPESLVGLFVELNSPLGMLRGTVKSVEPYVDADLGPGHWVTIWGGL